MIIGDGDVNRAAAIGRRRDGTSFVAARLAAKMLFSMLPSAACTNTAPPSSVASFWSKTLRPMVNVEPSRIAIAPPRSASLSESGRGFNHDVREFISRDRATCYAEVLKTWLS